MRSFLGITGVLCPYILNYGIKAHELTRLLKKGVPFEWGPKQIESMELIKEGVRNAEAVRPLDYESQGAIVLAVDTSYIAVGFYIYQEDVNDPKRHYYAKFGSRPLNDREARFSQPKRELFGLKEALRMNKRWLFGARKLIVETDAKYIKGMLENPDMMPTATINRWIDEILLYHFTLRHKAGATFGPDGLSRRPMQEGDPLLEVDEEEAGEPELPKFEMKQEKDPPPLPIDDFVDKIDSRRGYFHGIANSLDDFVEELEKADIQRDQECKILKSRLEKSKADLPVEQIEYVQQLVNVLALKSSVPEVSDRVGKSSARAGNSHSHNEHRGKEKFYNELHRSVGAIEQDEFMPHIKERLKDHQYVPEGFSDKQKKRLFRLANRFLIYEGRIYRRGTEGQHRLFVPKKKRTQMMTEAHDHNGHRGFFATRALLSQRFWWPEMESDIKEFVKTCHPCQERQRMLVRIPPTKTHTPSIFEVLHADILHMSPPSNGCKYIIFLC